MKPEPDRNGVRGSTTNELEAASWRASERRKEREKERMAGRRGREGGRGGRIA